MAGLLASYLERPSLHTAFSDPPLTAQQPFKAAILVAGFRLNHPPAWHRSSDGTYTKLTTRSLHVIGNTDVIVAEGTEPLQFLSNMSQPRDEHRG
jgi:hypothetical protein